MYDDTARNAGSLPGRKTDRKHRPARPFQDAAWYYHELGWRGILPVSTRGTKAPLFAGITGREGVDADDEMLDRLIAEFGRANTGLRLPWDIIGIDADDYDGKGGGATLRRLNGRLGPLPTTWRSTSRAPEDPVSGIYLFHAPRKPGWVWVSDLGVGSGIEIIQHHHRFATVAPSRHNSTGRPYRWWRGERLAEAPRPDDLPLLPAEWGRYLLRSREYEAGAKAAPAESAEWYGRVSGGPMCRGMADAARREAEKIGMAASGSGLHDTLIVAVTHLCRNAAEGHTGLERALSRVEAEFSRARRSRNLRAEWSGAVNTAIPRAAAGKQETEDPCVMLAGIRVRRNGHAA